MIISMKATNSMIAINMKALSKVTGWTSKKTGTTSIKMYDFAGQLTSKVVFPGKKIKESALLEDAICIISKFVKGKWHNSTTICKPIILG